MYLLYFNLKKLIQICEDLDFFVKDVVWLIGITVFLFHNVVKCLNLVGSYGCFFYT